MRAKEFITEKAEKPLRKSARQSIPGLHKNTTLDNNNHPYWAYRFGIALAGAPDNEDGMYPEGPLGSSFITVDYSDGDAEIRKAAEKRMGVSSRDMTGRGSEEMRDVVNTVSPVAQPKKNRYGV